MGDKEPIKSSHLGCLCIGAGRECLRLPSPYLSIFSKAPGEVFTFGNLYQPSLRLPDWIRVGLDSILSTDELSLKALLQKKKLDPDLNSRKRQYKTIKASLNFLLILTLALP